MQFEEWKLNNLGLQLLTKGKLEEGVAVLQLNTLLFPHSGNSFDSLAEGYLMQNNKALAIQAFQKSLELNPQNQNATDQLQRLGK
jgi:tetratricopeptide (TPR) repeat protein